jgi:hypothetical protein
MICNERVVYELQSKQSIESSEIPEVSDGSQPPARDEHAANGRDSEEL